MFKDVKTNLKVKWGNDDRQINTSDFRYSLKGQ